MFIVISADPLDDDCEILGPFKTERAAQAVAAAGSSEENEWTAVAVRPEAGSSTDGTAVVFRGFVAVAGQFDPTVGGAVEPYFVGLFPDLDAARAWAIADGLDAEAAFEIERLDQDDNNDEPDHDNS